MRTMNIIKSLSLIAAVLCVSAVTLASSSEINGFQDRADETRRTRTRPKTQVPGLDPLAHTGQDLVAPAPIGRLPCPEDLTGDSLVDIDDLLYILLAHWGPCQNDEACIGDLDEDGHVTIDDLLQVMIAWGMCDE